MAPQLMAYLDSSDRALFSRWSLVERDGPRPSRRAWLLLTHLGGAPVTIGVTLAAGLSATGTLQVAGQRALAVLVGSHLMVQAIKRAVGRPRPLAGATGASLVAVPDRFSFPSGHSAAAASVALGFATAFPALAPLFLMGALLVGFSRVVLGVHYPGDVVAGQVLAGIAFLLLRSVA